MFKNSDKHINQSFSAQTITAITREICKAKKVGGRKGVEHREAGWFVSKGKTASSKTTHKVVETVTKVNEKPVTTVVYTGNSYAEAAAAFGKLKGYSATTYYNNRKTYKDEDGKEHKGKGWKTTRYAKD